MHMEINNTDSLLPPRKKSNTKRFIVVIVLLVCIGGVAFGVQQYQAAQAAKRLAASQKRAEVTVRIIEGWTENQAIAEMQKQGLGITEEQLEEEIATLQKDSASKYAVLFEGLPTKKLSSEGYLYPDTYKFFADATPQEVVKKLLDNMLAKLTDDDMALIKKSDYSFYEILTLASVVEKEVANKADRATVAGIFLSRLSDTYPLQSDATVNYVTGKKTTTPSFADTKIQNEYNTYQNSGLPPTPINNPSIGAIEAVLKPKMTDYYFFLTTPPPENKAIYSKTYEEHLTNKAKYYGN